MPIDAKAFRKMMRGKSYEEAFDALIAEMNAEMAALQTHLSKQSEQAPSVPTRLVSAMWMVHWKQLWHSRSFASLPNAVLGSWVLGRGVSYVGHETYTMCALIEPAGGSTAIDVVRCAWPVHEIGDITHIIDPPDLEPPDWAVKSGRWPWPHR